MIDFAARVIAAPQKLDLFRPGINLEHFHGEKFFSQAHQSKNT